MNKEHTPVLYEEVLNFLNPQDYYSYLDLTFGAGGHSRGILERANHCLLTACDRDSRCAVYADALVQQYQGRFSFFCERFSSMCEKLRTECRVFSGIVIDLGVSSMQLDFADSGFSFMRDEKLTMTMGLNKHTAFDVVNYYSEARLSQIIFEYSDEINARKIARRIAITRQQKPIETTKELADLVANCIPRYSHIHPATKTFQAIRMEVNDELSELATMLPIAVNLLAKNGILCIISFHSTEDKIIKAFFNKICKQRVHHNKYKNVLQTQKNSLPSTFITLNNKHVLTPSRAEVLSNPRARSARCRVIKMI